MAVEEKGVWKCMKFIDLFAGVGGFRLGMERAGHECVWSCEIDKYCRAIYNHKWGKVEAGDVGQVDVDAIPDFDLLCAGFPCQSFSVAGKRKGFDDTRGTLFFDIARIASAKRPRLLLLENVKGLLSHDKGRTFAKILQTLDGLGYWVEWQVLDSQHFGVPQHRERVFIVGHLGEGGGREVFPIGEGSGVPSEKLESKNVCPTITSRYFKRGKTDPYILQEHSFSGKDGRGRGIRMFDNGVTPALTQQMGTGGGNVPMVMPCLTPDRQKKRQHGRRFKEDGEPMFTLTGQDVHGIEIANAVDPDGYLRFGARPRDENGKPQLLPICRRRIRRLTPVECERLQGFSDDWTKFGIDEKGNKIVISDTQRYKAMGNAVTTNVIEFLGRLLSEKVSRSVKEDG